MLRWRDPFTHIPEDSIERWLASEDPAEVALAEEALAEIGPERSLRLMNAVLERERALRRRGGRIAGVALWSSLSGASLLLGTLIEFPVLAAMLGSVSGPAVLFLYGLRPSRLQRRVWDRVARGSDPRGVPLLVDAWMPWEREINDVVTHGLVRLLPRLTEEDRDLLTTDQWARLETLLKTGASGQGVIDADLTRSALRAFGNVRPANARSALNAVAFPASVDAGELSAEQVRLQQTARNYLLAWDGPRPRISPPACPEPVRIDTSAREAPACVQQFLGHGSRGGAEQR